MVKIKTQSSGPFDNGACDMALNLLYIMQGEWKGKENLILDFREKNYDTKEWEQGEWFVREPYSVENTDEPLVPDHDLSLKYFTIEQLKKWDEDNYIIYPLFDIKSVKFYPDTYTTKWHKEPRECMTIEIESERDDIVREIFILLAGLANGGHMCGGNIRIRKEALKNGEWVARFGLDGDGSDRIYYVDDEYLD